MFCNIHIFSFLQKRQRGFTLIELLVVIGVIGVAGVVMMQILDPLAQLRKARDSQRKTDLALIQRALQAYYNDNGRYPPNVTGNPPCGSLSNIYLIAGNNGDGNNCIEWGSEWKPYMNSLPKDSLSTQQYLYFVVVPDQQTYYLYARLENTQDLQICAGGGCTAGVGVGGGGGGVGSYGCSNPIPGSLRCNYGISSPNVSIF